MRLNQMSTDLLVATISARVGATNRRVDESGVRQAREEESRAAAKGARSEYSGTSVGRWNDEPGRRHGASPMRKSVVDLTSV